MEQPNYNPGIKDQQPPVKNLIKLLGSRPALKTAIEQSIGDAQQPRLNNLEDFYTYLNDILTHIPNENDLMPSVRTFYYVLSKSQNDLLKEDPAFNEWIMDFVNDRGNFMDTAESVASLQTFIECPDYNIDDYIIGPSGWLTYNQFLARQLKPGKRPIAALCDDSIIVSPADSEFKGQWPITEKSSVVAKGVSYSVAELLGDSAYKERFMEGIFTHSFLSIADYHRYHVPVSGKIIEVNKTPGRTWVTEKEKDDGLLENIDDVGFQFTHTRGHIIIESKAGLVAVMPVGMGHISSVTLNVEVGTSLVKGDEFGYFAFGGSDMIMLFENNKVELTGEQGKHYKKGEAIGRMLQKV